MGCDIHCYAETYSPVTEEWSIATEPNPYYTPPADRLAKARERHHFVQVPAGPTTPFPTWGKGPQYTEEEAQALAADASAWEEDGGPTRPVRGYDGRNYGLFAILASVRNGYGFAGVETGEPTTPIDEPRGIPEDASAQYREEVEHWGIDGHSHTYFTLAELLAYDWDGHHAVNSLLAHPRGGWGGSKALPDLPADFNFDAFAVELELVLNVQGEAAAYERWPGLGFCGGISGPDAHQWRRVKWRVTHREQAGQEWFDYLDKLAAEARAAGRVPEFVRIVAFFDN